MQNVWCLVLEMSSGSQALTLPGFPAPPGPAMGLIQLCLFERVFIYLMEHWNILTQPTCIS